MNVLRLILVAALLLAPVVAAQQQSPVVPAVTAVPAGELIKVVIANELGDRTQQRKWMYVIERRVGSQSLTGEQVETPNGPLYRVLTMDGIPLTPDQRKKDDARIDRLLHDTGQQAKLKQQYDDDEQKLESLMRVMPAAFLYENDGVDGNLVRLKFRPNPDYDPPTYEARVVHSLAGIVLIDGQQMRLAKLSGQLVDRVEFGYGIFGHIDSGGTMEIGRAQVGPSQWKTSLFNIQLSGRMVFFKTISKQQYEVRSQFREVPRDLSLSQANKLLVSSTQHASGPEIPHNDPATTSAGGPGFLVPVATWAQPGKTARRNHVPHLTSGRPLATSSSGSSLGERGQAEGRLGLPGTDQGKAHQPRDPQEAAPQGAAARWRSVVPPLLVAAHVRDLHRTSRGRLDPVQDHGVVVAERGHDLHPPFLGEGSARLFGAGWAQWRNRRPE
jgi:hypothetical protein